MPVMSPGLLKKFRESIFEIFSNAVLHSRTEMGIFSCGQFFPRRHRLDFSVADLGIGMRRNIQENTGMDLSSVAALEWATQGQNTTKRGPVPGGLGLKLLSEFIDLNGGCIQILSISTMKNAIPSASASSAPTKSFEKVFGDIGAATSRTRCQVFAFEAYTAPRPRAPAKHTSISQLAAEWERDAKGRAALEDVFCEMKRPCRRSTSMRNNWRLPPIRPRRWPKSNVRNGSRWRYSCWSSLRSSSMDHVP